MTQRQLVAAGFIIYRQIENKLQYLLLQTSYGEHHWTPPKGHVDPGETEMETALRETEEESGYKKSSLAIESDFKNEMFYEVKGRPKKVVYWLAKLNNPEINVVLSDEHKAFKWLQISEACELVKYKEMQDALCSAESHIQSKEN